MEFWKDFWKRYRHFVPLLFYMIFYMGTFVYVENRPGYHMHLLVSEMDGIIPFCELFVIPYFLWFIYVFLAVVGFGLNEKERTGFYQLCANLAIGMTLFLLISLLWPNGHTLRPTVFPRENVFTDMVRALYQTDTSTNVFPSIHVFNSIAVHTAISHSESCRKHPALVKGSLILCVLIVLATMFLKQHTVIDVIGALVLNYVSYRLVYQPQRAAQKQAHNRYESVHHE